MAKWLLLLTATLLFVGIQSLRADDATSDGKRVCSQGRVVFGRLSCSSIDHSESVIEAYFFGATTLDEIQKYFPERFEKIRAKCGQKLRVRKVASQTPLSSSEVTQFRVESVDTCAGKRGYQQPCVTHKDCLENFCHPDRGTCSTVFTVPATAAQ